jgi:hypothetical protein
VEHNDVAIFRLPGRWQVAFFAVVMLPSCAKVVTALHFGRSLSFILIEVAAVALFWIVFLKSYTVQLRPDGIKLFSLWWLPWTDVVAVRYSNLLGLPSLRVKRPRGFSWSIPLYFVGDYDLASAIVRAAPPTIPFGWSRCQYEFRPCGLIIA